MRQRRVRVLVRPRRELLDPAVGEPGEVVGGAPKRCEHLAAGLVRQRHVHVGSSRERLEQRPFGTGQILEAVRENGLAVPGSEVGLEALARPGGAGRRDPRNPTRSSSAR